MNTLRFAVIILSAALAMAGPLMAQGPLRIMTEDLPNGTIGQSYSASLMAQGGNPPYSWSIASGSLPAGLSLSGSGEISGTPIVPGTFNFTVRVQDRNGDGDDDDDDGPGGTTRSLSIIVRLLPSVTTSSLPDGEVGRAYSASLSAAGGLPPYSWSITSGSLPAGLSLRSNGEITGTPSAGGSSSFTARVRDSLGLTATQTLSISVRAAAVTITTNSPAGGTVGVSYSSSLSATGGTPPYTWSVSSGSLPDGLTMSAAGAISGTPSTAGAFTFTVTVADSAKVTATKSLTITIAAPALAVSTASLPNGTVGSAYSASVNASGGTPPYIWSVSSGSLPDGLTMSAAGAISGTPSTAGAFTFTVTVADSAKVTATKSLTITIAAPALAVSTASLPNGTVGSPYSASTNASGGTPPYTWSVSSGSLPDGLTMSAAGAISGTPSAAAASTFTVMVTDSASATATKSLTITVGAPTLAVSTTSLPNGIVGSAYSASVNASGGTPPYAWSVSSGSLPNGLSMSAAGAISGTPGVAGASTFTVTVTDSASATATKSLTITVGAPALAVSTTSLPNGIVGSAYSASVNASGGTPPYAWSVSSGSLPDGLTMSPAGAISGTPSTAGASTFTVTVTDSASVTATKSLTITVGAPALAVSTASLPNGTIGSAYSASVNASGGTPPYAWSVSSGSLPSGLTMNAAGAISGTPSAAGASTFTVTVADSAKVTATKSLTITIAAPALAVSTSSLPNGTVGTGYSASVSASGGTPPYTLSVTAGSLPGGLSMSAGGAISGTPAAAGTSTFTVRATDSANATATGSLSITIAVPAPTVSTSSLPSGTVGTAYSASLNASGGTPPYTWSLLGGSLPDGLSMDAGGTISGTPTTAGGFAFMARATDSANRTASRSLSIMIAGPAPAVSTSNLPAGTVGTNYSASVAASGGTPPYTWSIESGTLPDGLSLSTGGAITGSPTSAGAFSFTVRATDSTNRSASRVLSITISAPAPAVSTTSLPNGTVGVAYSASISATSGTPPYAWSITSGSLPGGLSLSSGGAISGTPATAGISTFSVRVTDSANAGATSNLSITIAGPTLAVTTTSLPNGTVGAVYSASLGAAGGTAPYVWSLASGSLPGGLSMAPNGSISGTPAGAGEFTFTATVSDAGSAAATRGFTITIAAPALSVTTTVLPNGTVGVGYSASLNAAGGTPAYAWSNGSGSLPDGLSIDAGGMISGTPSKAGTFSFTARVADSAGGASTKSLSVTIAPPALTITNGSVSTGTMGLPYSATLAAAGGVGPYTWSVANGGLPEGIVLSSSGSVSGTPSRTGSYTFLVRVTDSTGASATRTYSITITATGLGITTTSLPSGTVGTDYFFQLAATGGTAPYAWSRIGGALPPGIEVTPAGAVGGTPTQPGLFQFSMRVTDSTGTTAERDFSITIAAPLTLTACPTDVATVGQPYSGVLSAQGGQPPYRWAISAGALPSGLSLNSETGVVGGTPPAAGSFDFTVQAVDRALAPATRRCSIQVRSSTGAPPVLVSISPASVTAGPSEFRITVNGRNFTAPSSVARGSIVQLDGADLLTTFASTAQLTALVPAGVTTVPGQAAVRVVTYNPPGEAPMISESVTLTISTPALMIATTMLPAAVLDAPYEQALAASGGRTPYTWAVIDGALPPGFTLGETTGVLSGRLTSPGTFRFTVRVTDAAQATHTRELTLESGSQLTVVSPAALSPGTIGSEFAQTMIAAGGAEPYQWTILSGSLPTGLSFSSGGLLSGTPTEPGSFSFNVRVTDRDGRSASRAYTMVVLPSGMPRLSVSGLGESVAPAEQPRVILGLDAPYPLPLAGRLTVEFAPAPGIQADDRSIQFSTGGRAVDFTVPANQTRAVFSVPELALQTGTVAGEISLGVTLRSAGVDLVPTRLALHDLRVDQQAPVVTSVRLTRTATGFEVAVNGFATNREVTQATFRIMPPQSSSAQPVEFTLQVADAARRWYQDAASIAFGSQFTFVQPFTIQSGSEQVGSISVTLTNSIGNSQTGTATF